MVKIFSLKDKLFIASIVIIFILLSVNALANPPISPQWVFDHWMWEDDLNTQSAVEDIVAKCEKYDIPLGAVIIDSPWEEEYNNFTFNKKNYPEPENLINKLHSKNIKIVLWMTGILNKKNHEGRWEPSMQNNKTYYEALEKGYLANDGNTYKWWKGEGAFIDYTNPDAVAWWHSLMDKTLNLGIDGWKVDGIDFMFPANGYGKNGKISRDKFRNIYYSDTYEYTIKKNPYAVTLVRSVDNILANPRGFSPISHSPVTWVGDQKHNWGNEGFLEALKNIFAAAKLGYAVIGSDIPGYHGEEEITKEFLLRWGQFGALCPFMETGGHGNSKPWGFDDETLRIYRFFVKLHQELKPYLYSMMMKAHLEGTPIIRVQKGKWQYMLGDSIFVSVIYENKNEKEVLLPQGNWIDFWDDNISYAGNKTFIYNTPLDKYPIFIKAGSIIPLYVSDNTTQRSFHTLKGYLTLDIYPDNSADSTVKFQLYEEGKEKTEISLSKSDNITRIDVQNNQNKNIFRIKLFTKPEQVLLNGSLLNTCPQKKAQRHKGTKAQRHVARDFSPVSQKEPQNHVVRDFSPVNLIEKECYFYDNNAKRLYIKEATGKKELRIAIL